MRRAASIVCFLALLLANAHAAIALEGPSLDELLSRPLTPGVVTLLVAYANEPRAQARLIEALSNPDPLVRGAAARVINVGAIVPAAGGLLKALQTEQAPLALLEEGRALIALGGPSSHAPVMEVVARLRAAHEDSLAEILIADFVQGSGTRSATFVELVNATSSPTTWMTITMAAVRDDPGSIVSLATALLAAANAGGWQGLLAGAHELQKPLPEESLVAALRTGTADIQTITCWYAAASGLPVTDAVRAAIPATSSGSTLSACDRLRRLVNDGSNRKSSIDEARDEMPSQVVPLLRRQIAIAAKGVPAHASRVAGIRMAAGYPPGVVADIAQAAGCQWPAVATLGGGLLTYGDRGRAQSGAVVGTKLPSECVAAERALVLTDLAPPDHLPVAGTTELVLFRLDKDGVECLAAQRSRPGALGTPVRVGEHNIKPPPKTRDVRPTYPVASQQAHVQGIVIMDATIGVTGCVQTASVLRSIDDSLDIAAIDAVSQWRFTPTLMDGHAVPVIMTVTVQFELR